MSFETPNIGLEVWDQGKDDFNHSQLANDWVAVDNHDHTPGRGLRITTEAISPESITTALIALGNITQALLANHSVGTPQLIDGSVTTEVLASPSVFTSNIANQEVTYEKLDPTVLPLGSVILWYRKSGATNLPGGGWEICDGRPWGSITNSLGYTTGNIPDMRDAFAIGADINGIVAPSIGSTGGTNEQNFSHSHTVNAHSHSVPSHAHGISVDGNHTHGFLGDDGGYYSAFEQLARAPESASPVRRALFVPQIALENTGEEVIQKEAPLQFTGNHSHGGATAASSEFNTSLTSTGTGSSLGSVNMRPQYVSLLYIMRVR